MKNKSKKYLSLLLALLLCLTSFVPAFAEEKTAEESSSDVEFLLGDVDGNGIVQAADARIVLRLSAVLDEKAAYTKTQLDAADYNRDSKMTAADARYILRAAAGLDPFAVIELPPTTQPPETTTKAPETTTRPPVVLTPENRTYKLEQSDLFSNTYAQYAVLYDYDNDKILYGKNMHAPCHPASTTKVITACLGCEYLGADYVLTVGNELNLVESNTSRAGLYKGQRIKFKEILKCLLAPSGCDAAYTIAVHVARVAAKNPDMSASRALAYFVNMMNNYAKKLGMNDSHFANPDGYPNSNHYVSAYDMTIIAVKAFSFKLIRDIVKEPYVTAYFESGGSVSYTNTNETINPNSSRYYPYMVGIKTGSHSQAGQCLVTVAQKYIDRTGKTKTFVAVVFNCPSKYARYSDLKSLYNTAFSYFWRQP